MPPLIADPAMADEDFVYGILIRVKFSALIPENWIVFDWSFPH